MYTVIIAKKQHIDWINRYRVFFEPFLTGDIDFCEWNDEGAAADECIPGIYDSIGGRKEWRAVIVFDDAEARKQHNPFDVVKPVEEQEPDDEIDVEAKKTCYDKAAEQPLTRLVTYLCPLPLDASETHEEIETAEKKDISGTEKADEMLLECSEMRRVNLINSYKDAAGYKRKLRNSILEQGTLKAELPQDVYCISLRTIEDGCSNEEKMNKTAWQSTSDVRYSNFGDRNMYFDRMRYFVYDLLPEEHVNYKFGYLEFVYTLLVFAGNPMPTGSVVPNRLYCLESDCSENNLKELISNYDQKLENTVSFIESKKREIEREIPGEMSDADAEKEFQSDKTIPVSLNPNFNMEGFFAEPGEFGLYEDRPRDEYEVWTSMYHKSENVMHRFMKQPRRSLEKATEELRLNSKNDPSKVLGLNHFQIDDIREFAETKEDEMVKIETKDFYNTERYEEKMKEQSDSIRHVIETRMTKKTALILWITVLLVSVSGFIPVLFFNESVISLPIPLIMTLVFLAVMAAAGMIALLVFRHELREKIEDYNMTMRSIRLDVVNSMDEFSRLLSHAGCVMRGNDTLCEASKKDNTFMQRIRVLKGHVEQIRSRQTDLRMLFGEYLHEHALADAGEYYKYNFEKAREYSYPVPFEGGSAVIDFIEDGSTAEVPFALINGVTLRMEDLYE